MSLNCTKRDKFSLYNLIITILPLQELNYIIVNENSLDRPLCIFRVCLAKHPENRNDNLTIDNQQCDDLRPKQ